VGAGDFCALALVAMARIVHLGLADPARPGAVADGVLPDRGEILDRNGMSLARAFPAYALWYNPKALGDGSRWCDPAEVAQRWSASSPMRMSPN
jgi:cell division protein FtsI (penicillin-binding protein 3)